MPRSTILVFFWTKKIKLESSIFKGAGDPDRIGTRVWMEGREFLEKQKKSNPKV